MKNVLLLFLCSLFAFASAAQSGTVRVDSVKVFWAANLDTTKFNGAANIWYVAQYKSDGSGWSNVENIPVGDTATMYQALVNPIIDLSRQLAGALTILRDQRGFFKELKARDANLKAVGLTGMFDLLKARFGNVFIDNEAGNYTVIENDVTDNKADLELNAQGAIRLKWTNGTNKNIAVRVLSESAIMLLDYPANNQETLLLNLVKEGQPRRWESLDGKFILRKKLPR